MEKLKRDKENYRRNIYFLGLTSFFTDVSTEMIYPYIAIYVKSVLNAPIEAIGLMEGIAETTASLFKVFSGWFADKVRKRKIFAVAGYGISTVAKPLFGITNRVWQVIFLRFVDRLGKGIRTSPRDAIIAQSVGKEEQGKAFGFHRMLDTLGAVLGPLIAFVFLKYHPGNYRTLFILTFIPGIIALLFLIFGVKEPKFLQNISEDKKGQNRKKIKLSSDFIWILIFVGFVFGLSKISDMYLILRAKDIGISASLIAIFYMLFNIVYSIFAYPAGIIADKVGVKKVLSFAFLFYSVVMFLVSQISKVWQIWLIGAFYGIFYAMFEGNIRALISLVSPDEYKATYFGIFHTIYGVVNFPANLIAGFLWSRFGFKYTFLWASGLAFLSFVGLTFKRIKTK